MKFLYWFSTALIKRRLVIATLAIPCLFLFKTTEAAYSVSSCTVSMVGLNFDVYDPLGTNPDDVQSTLTVTCTVSGSGNNVFVPIQLSKGSSGSYTQRTLKNGSYTMNYNIYTNSSRSTIWGDGTSSTSTKSASFGSSQGTGSGKTSTVTIYGRITALQYNVVPGNYSDSITATITF